MVLGGFRWFLVVSGGFGRFHVLSITLFETTVSNEMDVDFEANGRQF